MARKATGLALVFTAFSGTAHASVPEIDPASASSAVALLVGGVLFLTDRFYRRK